MDIFSTMSPTEQWQIGSFSQILKPTLKKLYEKDPSNWDQNLNHVLASYRVTPNLTIA